LKRKLHEVKGEHAQTKLVHLAFNSALIVSYSRPFHWSNDGQNREVSLLDSIAAVLNPNQIKLHDKIVPKRDQAFAHSDAEAREIRDFDYESNTVKLYKNTYVPLTTKEVKELGHILTAWIVHLEERRSQLVGGRQHVTAS